MSAADAANGARAEEARALVSARVEDSARAPGALPPPPRTAVTATIPGLLTTMQQEWDSLMLETHQLRSGLDLTRQQLSHALYQHDAACRVIAKLLREKDQLQARLATLQAAANTTTDNAEFLPSFSSNNLSSESAQLLNDVKREWAALAKALLTRRKSRSHEAVASNETVAKWTAPTTFASLHAAAADKAGVNSLVYDPSRRGIWTGGNDFQVLFCSLDSKTVQARLLGHTKKVNQLAVAEDGLVVSASDDRTCRVWVRNPSDESANGQGDFPERAYALSWTQRHHQRAVTAVQLHPDSTHVFTASAKGRSLALHDLHSGQLLCDYGSSRAADLLDLKVHPDGMLIALTEANTVRMFDVSVAADAAPIVTLGGEDGHSSTADVVSVAFSGNGYHLATADAAGKILLWDLRKTKTAGESLEWADVRTLKFDEFGHYLAACGKQSSAVFGFEAKNKLAPKPLVSLDGVGISDCAFDPERSAFFLAACNDRHIRAWGEHNF